MWGGVILFLAALILAPAAAQESTPEPGVTGTATLTELPSSTPYPTPTLAPATVSESTDDDTSTPAETPSLTPSETPFHTPVISATAAPISTHTSTSMPLQWESVFYDSFDDHFLEDMWFTGPATFSHFLNGEIVLAYSNDIPMYPYILQTSNSVQINLQFQIVAGALQITLQQGLTQGYSLIIRDSGEIELYRDGTPAQAVNSNQIFLNTWHTLQLVINNTEIQVAIDGVLQLSYVDSTPLPAGEISMAGGAFGLNNVFMLDNVSVMMSTPSLTSSPANFPPAINLSAQLMVQSETSEQIIYTERSASTGNKHVIFAANPDGSNPRALTSSSYNSRNPSVSSDGTQIAFASDMLGGSSHVAFVMNSDGTNIRPFNTSFSSTVYIPAPSWSPNGQTLTFHANGQEGGSRIFVAHVNAQSTPQQVTFGSGSSTTDLLPQWSPDGSRIAYIHNNGFGETLFVVNVDGTNPYQVNVSPVISRKFEWSPDGNFIAYGAADSVATLDNLRIEVADVSNLPNVVVVALAQSRSTDFIWSVNGASIIFSAIGYCATPGAVATCASDLFSANADGSTQAPINLTSTSTAEHPGPSDDICLVSEFSPIMSPNGNQILFTRTYRNSSGCPIVGYLAVIPSTGGIAIELPIMPYNGSSIPRITAHDWVAGLNAPVLTPTATPTPTLTPTPVVACFAEIDWEVKFRDDWVSTPDNYTTNVRWIIGQGNGVLVATQFIHPVETGVEAIVESVEVIELLGVHPDSLDTAGQPVTVLDATNNLRRQDYIWVRVRVTFLSGIVDGVDLSGTAVDGAMVLYGPELGYFLTLYGECAAYIPPELAEPDPEAQRQLRYISCLLFGLGVEDLTPVAIRDAENTGRARNINVATFVDYVGHESDPEITDRVESGIIAAPPVDTLNNVPMELRDQVAAQGFALIRWDDGDMETSNEWWILAALLKTPLEDETSGTYVFEDCPPAYQPSQPPPPPLPAPSLLSPVVGNAISLFGFATSIAPTQVNHPAVMGSFGFHYALPGASEAYTLDTVPLTVEGCVDDYVEGCLHDESAPIPIYAPVPGCVLHGWETVDDPGGYIPDQMIILKFTEQPITDCTATYGDVFEIGFFHADRRIYPTLPTARRGLVQQGDLIGYLCPPADLTVCNLGGSPTHVATTIVIRLVGVVLPPVHPSPDELQDFFPNLHDCIRLPMRVPAQPGDRPVNVSPQPDECTLFGY